MKKKKTIYDYTTLFPDSKEAINFEEYILAADEGFLPAAVRKVIAGSDPTPEYWEFLIEQKNKHDQ